MLSHAEEQLQRVVNRRRELEAQQAEIAVELAGLRVQEAEWLRRAEDPAGQPEPTSRTASVLALLRASEAPLSPKQLAVELDDDPRKMGGTLNLLKEQGNARREGRGRWVAT